MVKSKNIIIGISIISICSISLLFLLASSSVPVFTVKELMDHPRYMSYLNRKIQLRGILQDFNDTDFFITDPIDRDNGSLIIHVEAINVERPVGFEIGKQVLVEGMLLSTSNIWSFKASRISTQCPSKYETDQDDKDNKSVIAYFKIINTKDLIVYNVENW